MTVLSTPSGLIREFEERWLRSLTPLPPPTAGLRLWAQDHTKEVTHRDPEELLCSPEFVHHLCRTFTPGSTAALHVLQFVLGLRPGSLLAVTLGDLRRAMIRGGSEVVLAPFKFNFEGLTVPLSEFGLEVVRKICQYYLMFEDGMVLAKMKEEEYRKNFQLEWRTWAKYAAHQYHVGPQVSGTHALRRARATYAHACGYSVVELQNVLGHRTIKTTMAYIRTMEIGWLKFACAHPYFFGLEG